MRQHEREPRTKATRGRYMSVVQDLLHGFRENNAIEKVLRFINRENRKRLSYTYTLFIQVNGPVLHTWWLKL